MNSTRSNKLVDNGSYKNSHATKYGVVNHVPTLTYIAPTPKLT